LGHVYSFEFIPKNIEVFRKNLSLNKELEKRITLVPKPLGISSNQKVTCIENGPGSRIDFDNNVIRSMSLDTISIDDFVDSEQIKVDFIKMDIEGSELSALKGAEKTIRKFKPQLAISIYHSMNDFVNIPAWLKSLGLGYKLYLGHYTIHNEETVIYARM
jgi:FkbM family methyltransferase